MSTKSTYTGYLWDTGLEEYSEEIDVEAHTEGEARALILDIMDKEYADYLTLGYVMRREPGIFYL